MNRAERRRKERENQKAVNNKQLSKSLAMKQYHDDLYMAGIEAGRRQMIACLLNMTAYTLSYKLDLGKKRLPKLMLAICNNMDAFNTGHLSKEDYSVIKDEIRKKGFCMED